MDVSFPSPRRPAAELSALDTPWCALLIVERASLNLFEFEATTSDTGPSVETIWRGVSGRVDDVTWAWLLFESPASSAWAAEEVLASGLGHEALLARPFTGSPKIRPPSDASLPGVDVRDLPFAVFRPFPASTPGVGSDGEFRWEWRWFPSAKIYRSAFAPLARTLGESLVAGRVLGSSSGSIGASESVQGSFGG